MARGGYQLGHLAKALPLNPAARRISPFIATRRLPQGVTEALDLRNVGRFTDADLGTNPDLYADRALLPEAQTGSQSIRNELQYSSFNNLPFSIGLASTRVLLRPASNSRRVYLFIINTHAAQILYVAFGQDSSQTIGVPINANMGTFEWNVVVPQDDIFLIANGAATTGVMIYSNDNLIGSAG